MELKLKNTICNCKNVTSEYYFRRTVWLSKICSLYQPAVSPYHIRIFTCWSLGFESFVNLLFINKLTNTKLKPGQSNFDCLSEGSTGFWCTGSQHELTLLQWESESCLWVILQLCVHTYMCVCVCTHTSQNIPLVDVK